MGELAEKLRVLRKELRSLLYRPESRRGPYVISDAAIRANPTPESEGD